MRRMFVVVTVAAIGVSGVSTSVWAQEPRSSIQGFGGLRIGTTGSPETAVGGTLSGSLTSNVQVFGEVGRLSSVLPTSMDLLLGFSPVDVGVSAWYGTGGVRLISSPAAVRPYAEASGGIARLRAGLGADIGRFDPLVDAALRVMDRTSPIGTLGAGVRLEGGPFVADVGYRYHRIFAENWLQAVALGQDLNVSEVRVGVGVRF
jgi:opacity protein-like surface antigen